MHVWYAHVSPVLIRHLSDLSSLVPCSRPQQPEYSNHDKTLPIAHHHVLVAEARGVLHTTLHPSLHLQALEGKLVAVQREVQAEATRRLAAAEADWSSRLAAREQELQHNAQMQLQQVGRALSRAAVACWGLPLGWCIC